jgi:hypothetical protein
MIRTVNTDKKFMKNAYFFEMHLVYMYMHNLGHYYSLSARVCASHYYALCVISFTEADKARIQDFFSMEGMGWGVWPCQKSTLDQFLSTTPQLHNS